MTEASGAGSAVELCGHPRQIHLGRREYAGVDIAAQCRGPHSRANQPAAIASGSKRIAQVQTAIFVDQQRAHDEAGLIVIEMAAALERREHALKALHETPVSQPEIVEVPAQVHQALRRVVVGETGVEYDDPGKRSGALHPGELQGT